MSAIFKKPTDIQYPAVLVRPLAACSRIVALQDSVTNTLANKEAKKKLSPTNAKALNTMRQRLKKHNIPYQEAIDKIKENPEIATESESEEGASSESDESSDEEEVAAKGVICYLIGETIEFCNSHF